MAHHYSLNRKLGAFHGVPLGDSLGSVYEFPPFRSKASAFDGCMPSIPHSRSNEHGFRVSHKIGQVTDDTELSVELMRLVTRGYKPADAVRSYHAWANSGTYSIGTNTRTLFKDYAEKNLFAQYKRRFQQSFPDDASAQRAQSNGHLMRASPLALIIDPELRRNIARADTYLTNPSDVCAEAVVIYTDVLAIIFAMPDDASDATCVSDVKAYLVQSEARISTDVKKALTDSYPANFSRCVLGAKGAQKQAGAPGAGWTLHALSAALWAVQHATCFFEGMKSIIRLGGDTDTNGAIAGALLGARFGFDAMKAHPETAKSIEAVLSCQPEITSGFPSRGMKVVARPTNYHPNCLIELASIDEVVVTSLNKPVDARAFVASLTAQPVQSTLKLEKKRKQRDEPGIVVLVTGWSQSGKSTLSDQLRAELGVDVAAVIHQDSKRAHRGVPTKKIDGKRHWEGPEFTDWPALLAKVEELRGTYAIVIVEGYTILDCVQLRDSASVVIECAVSVGVASSRRKSFPTEWGSAAEYYRSCVYPEAVKHDARVAAWKSNAGIPIHVLGEDTSVRQRVESAAQFVKSGM